MAIIYLTRFPERPAPLWRRFQSLEVLWRRRMPLKWCGVRLLPEGFFPRSRENRAGNPSPLLCLAPHGVFRAAALARRPVGSYPAFSPLPSTISGQIVLSVGDQLPVESLFWTRPIRSLNFGSNF